MSDFDTILGILNKVYPENAERPYLNFDHDGLKVIEFPRDDDWYSLCLIFDEHGKFMRAD